MSAVQTDGAQRTQNARPALLAGLKVIDFATGLAGSATALYLAEAGAEVVKIERPRHEAERDAARFHVLDRGKRRVTEGDGAARAAEDDADAADTELGHHFASTEVAASDARRAARFIVRSGSSNLA